MAEGGEPRGEGRGATEPAALVLTCEHAQATLPPEVRRLFAPHRDVLRTHRAVDFGAAKLTQSLAKKLATAPLVGDYSRLVVDLNRSIDHPRLTAPWIRSQGSLFVEELVAAYYLPYRAAVAKRVLQAQARAGWALHLSVHSFTPALRGRVRDCDVGVLYDPARAKERVCAKSLRQALQKSALKLRVRANRPYLGKSDGLTTALRLAHKASRYVGIELEVNQALVMNSAARWREVLRELTDALAPALRALCVPHRQVSEKSAERCL